VLAIGRGVGHAVVMRGSSDRQLAMLSSLSPEDLIPPDHPIRRIRKVVEAVLVELDGEFDVMYARSGRPSVPPESLLKATILMAMYSIRSERAFCERLNHDLLFKWFLDLPIDAKAFDATTFSKNRQRLLDHEIADRFFAAVVTQAKLRRYVSSDHFSVDGTLLEAWASHKSFQPKDGPRGPVPPGRNAEVDFHGERHSNQTHVSTTDPEAGMARKSFATAAQLSYAGHLLMEHRSALVVDIELSEATGCAECSTALEMLGRLPPSKRRRTVAGDKAYDTKDFVADVRELGFTPHLAPNTKRNRSTIDGRTTRHEGHRVSQRIRKRIEEPFGWIKTIAGGRKLRYIGRAATEHGSSWPAPSTTSCESRRSTQHPHEQRTRNKIATDANPAATHPTPPPASQSRFSTPC
jgi:transposase